MSITVQGIVEGGRITPSSPLPEGARVEIHCEQLADGDPGCFRDLAAPTSLTEMEMKELRELLSAEQFDALMEITAQGGPDVDAISRLRFKSMT